MNTSRQYSNPPVEEGIVLKGYQKKLKTMKKKYFVLYKDTTNSSARLEYYDNERKFKSNLPPKRVIKLKNCFNINRRLDTRYDFVISLSTKDGAFGIVLETESEMIKWLETLISLQRNDANTADGSNPEFNYFWQVTVERRGLAEEKGLIGNYYVGLTSQSLIFIRIGSEKTALGEKRLPKVEFPLITIRRCGDSQCYFYIEVGRKSIIGPGEFWMQTENSHTAENMHSKILSAMSSKNDIEPMRKRSSSATEASKPINVDQRRQNQQENKANNSPQTVLGFSRDRCDSLPSRNRTSSESQSLAASSTQSVRIFNMSGRSHSYQRHSNSPPMSATIGCSESEESSVSIDEPDDNSSFLPYRFNSRSSEGVIIEENTDELMGVEIKQGISKGSIDNETLPGSLGSPGNNEESYLSMAPINVFKENRMKLTDECRVPSNSSSLRAVRSAILEFPEYALDKTSKNYTNETDLQFERPTRAYSIGSKAEHSKFSKRTTTNLNDLDQNTMRVRAFSVGSRAKIPRCDLQRGVLSPKSLMEHNTNSNNNLCALNESTNVPHPFLNTASSAACSEKKSTSAPLLIHKSQNSVDRMSDLMEIDFSKPSNNSKNRIYTSARVPIFKSFMPTTQTYTTQIVQLAEENQFQKISNPLNPLIESMISSQTDNGYLEMKPVGGGGDTLIKKNSPTKHFKDSSNINSVANVIAPASTIKKINFTTVSENKFNSPKPNVLQHQQQQPVLQNKIEVLATGPKEVNTGSIIPLQTDNKELTTEIKKKDDLQEKLVRKQQVPITDTIGGYYIPEKKDKSELNIKDQTNLNILTAKYAKLALDSSNQKPTQIQQTENKSSDKDDYINIIRKTNEQISAQLKNNITKLNNPTTTVSIAKEEHDKDKDKDKECVKLTHSNSNEENKNDDATMSRKSIETGYEILQIKSDSSLQAHHKSLNRHNGNRIKDKQQQLSQNTPCRPRSTNSSATLMTTTTTTNALNLSGGCSSSSTSALNYISTPIATKGEQLNKTTNNNASSNTNATTTSSHTPTPTPTPSSSSTATITTSPLNLVSRPPSVSSEHELYYASLDLPQPSGDICVKNKLEISSGSSPIAEIVTSANNSYAKIDFDVSDSSSSSSKNVNVNVIS